MVSEKTSLVCGIEACCTRVNFAPASDTKKMGMAENEHKFSMHKLTSVAIFLLKYQRSIVPPRKSPKWSRKNCA